MPLATPRRHNTKVGTVGQGLMIHKETPFTHPSSMTYTHGQISSWTYGTSMQYEALIVPSD